LVLTVNLSGIEKYPGYWWGTLLSVSVRAFQRRLTKEGRPPLDVDTTISMDWEPELN
jgi:hypothetical protein